MAGPTLLSPSCTHVQLVDGVWSTQSLAQRSSETRGTDGGEHPVVSDQSELLARLSDGRLSMVDVRQVVKDSLFLLSFSGLKGRISGVEDERPALEDEDGTIPMRSLDLVRAAGAGSSVWHEDGTVPICSFDLVRTRLG